MLARLLLAVLTLLSCAGLASADTLDWNVRPATDLRAGGTDAALINGVTVTTSGAIGGTFDSGTLAIQPTATANGTTGYVNTTMDATVDNESVTQTTTITFSEPVYNVSVVVGDIDGGPTFIQGAAAFNDIVEFRANGGTVLPTSGTPVNATKVTWTAATGRASANNFNVTDNTGDVTVTWAGPITSFTIRHIAGANSNVTNPTQQFVYVETVTYTRSPRVTLTKISNGGVGPFSFTGTNGFGSDTITTAVSGTGVTGVTKVLSAANTTTTITEAIPAGYVLTAATCTGLGTGTATPNLATGDIVLNAAATAPGANIACTYTNGKRPTVQVGKTSVGGVGAFSFTGTNGYSGDTITTVTSGSNVAGTVRTLTAASTATTITETIPAGYTVTAITCTGLGGGTATPNLAAGSVALNAAATAAANAVQCTFTNTRTPTMKVQKTTLGGFGGAFSFAQTNLASAPGNITTTAANTPTPAAPAAINVSAIGTAVTLTETPIAGYVASAASCADANSAITGNTGSFGTLAGNVLTVPAARVVAGADFTCVFTNTRTPTMKVQKTTLGGFGGPFSFAQTNLASAPANITTTAANTATPAAPAAINISTIGTAVTLTETPAAGYAPIAASCTDANSAITGNPASFGTLAGNVLTVPAANVVAGADITCGFTNAKLPTVQVSKTSVGGVGAFSFTGTNGYSGDTITTVTSNVTVAGAVRTLATASTATTISETVPAGYAVTAISCTGLGSGTAIPNLAAGSVALDAAATAPGNAVQCTFTNTKTPTVKVQKTTLGGFGGPFSFAQTNLASAPANITTAAAGTATPAAPTAINVTAIGAAVTLTETPAAGYALTAASCSDANAAITGNPASFGTLAGNVLTISAANVVAGADVTCGFTNTKLPTVQVSKISVGAVGAFTFAGTNGYSGDTITTITSNVAAAGAVRTLTAASAATTIAETIPSGYTVTAISCTGLGSGTATPNLAAGSVALNAAATAAGNAVACTFTNTKTPTVKVQKTTLGGFGGPFSFAQTNLASAPANITTTAASTATPAAPAAINISTIGTAVTLTETPAAGYAVTAASCTDANSAITGNAGSFGTLAGNVLTVPAANIVAGADLTCGFTNSKLPTLQVSKTSVGGVGAFSFTGTNGYSGDTITTVTSNVTVAGAVRTLAAASTATTITETIPAGYAVTAITCSGLGSGTATPNLAAGSVALNAAAAAPGNAVACAFTNIKTPTVKVQKTTLGGFGGPFSFAQTNLASAPANITTIAANTATPAAPTAINVTTVGTAVTLTETPASGYTLTAASCTDANSAITGNPASFGTLAGNVLTVPAATIVAGADITCGVTNSRLPTIQISKISVGAVGTFSFTGTNGYSGDTITTVTSNVAVAGAVRTLTAVSTATTITETIPAGYTVTAISCTGLGSGTATPNLAAGSVALNAAATAAGNAVACTFTNTKTPTMKVQKITSGGFGGPFSFAQTNLASAPANITTTAANTATPAVPAAINVTAIGTAITITETPVSGYFLSAVSCTDANSAITGNTGSFGTVAGNALTIPNTTVKAGADFTCVFTNTLFVPNFTVTKAQTSGPNPVTAAGQVLGYTITVQNTGNQPLTGVTISNDTLTTGAGTASLTPTFASGDTNANSILDTTETWTYTVNYTVTQAAMNAGGTITNAATVTTGQAGPKTGTSAATPITITRAMTIVKTASTPGPVSLGQLITYTFKVKNAGNVTITAVGVTETFNGFGTTPVPGNETLSIDAAPVGDSTDATANNSSWSTLAPGDEITFTAPYTVVQQDIDNLQ